MVVSMSTRPESPALQQFFKAQINLPSSPFSIKKCEGDWFTIFQGVSIKQDFSIQPADPLQLAVGGGLPPVGVE